MDSKPVTLRTKDAMRSLTVTVLAALFAAGLGGSPEAGVATVRGGEDVSRVLALLPAKDGPRLAWVEPRTLRQLPLRSLRLPGTGRAWRPIFSPSGRYLAFGGTGRDGVRIVDLRQMKLTSRVARSPRNLELTPLAWPEPRRLLVRAHLTGERAELLVTDPAEQRIVARSLVEGWADWAPVGRKLVVLIYPRSGIQSARLATIGPDGGILNAKDVGVVAGIRPATESEPRAQIAWPGFAVDSADQRAFIVGVGQVAEVDLETFEISFPSLSEKRSILSRLLAWLEPAAQAKLSYGWSRQVSWLGEDLLAVSGSNYEGENQTPAGLQLVDTKSGTVRTLERRASVHRFSQGLLLAFGAGHDGATDADTGTGLAAYALDGSRLWQRFADEPIWSLEIGGGYAYVPFGGRVRSVDLATGSVARTIRTGLPMVIVRDAGG